MDILIINKSYWSCTH